MPSANFNGGGGGKRMITAAQKKNTLTGQKRVQSGHDFSVTKIQRLFSGL